MVELKAFFFMTLYHRAAAFDFNIIAYLSFLFHAFLDIFSSLGRCFSCILSKYLGCTIIINLQLRTKKYRERESLIYALLG
jgi:predicted membrane protein